MADDKTSANVKDLPETLPVALRFVNAESIESLEPQSGIVPAAQPHRATAPGRRPLFRN